MGTGAITQYVDVAQLVLYLFWIFFFGLVYYLVVENHREGYPMMETDNPKQPTITGWPLPKPKTFLLADGREVTVPNPRNDNQGYSAEQSFGMPGSPIDPVGDPMFANVGPGAYARRADEVDMEGDHPRIMPLRYLPGFGVNAKGKDPRGKPVWGADGVVGGTVHDLWLDHSEQIFRYLEIEVPSPNGPRLALLPMTFARVTNDGVKVQAILGHQFTHAPAPRQPDKITRLEEEKVCAFYGAGTLYAEPNRAEPLV